MLKVTSQFQTDRHPGLCISWEFGSNKLHLLRIGGPQGSYKIQTKTDAKYRNADAALDGANEWFDLLDRMYKADTEADQAVRDV